MDEALRRRARTDRAAIVGGALRGPALLALLCSVPITDRDVLLDVLLGLDDAPDDASDLPRGSVPYLPCGVEEILAAIDEARIGPASTFVDIGAGLGRVAVLVHLLTGASAHGIEIQGELVTRARGYVRALGLDRVTFEHDDAARAVLEGTVFFLYAPFVGRALETVEQHLVELGRRRPIVVCAVGVELHDEAWHRRPSPVCASLVTYTSR